MDLNFRNLPIGSLPYNNIQTCKQMMLRLYENIPFLPELPVIDANDTMLCRTIANVNSVTIKDGKLLLPDTFIDKFELDLINFEKIINSDKLYEFESYGFDAPYMEIYSAMLQKFKPKYTIIELIGPFSFSNMVFNRTPSLLLTDSVYSRFISLLISVKALWFIYKVKSISPQTTPLIIFNENLLFKFGTLKRANESITNDTVTILLSKVFQRVRKAGGLVGVQSFNKCNWQLVFDTNCVDLISFDAYNNSNNLSILSTGVNKFLAKGGYINWGIVPVTNVNTIRALNIDVLSFKLEEIMQDFISRGVSSDLLYKNFTMSIQRNLADYPILFAEKALILTNKMAKIYNGNSNQN